MLTVKDVVELFNENGLSVNPETVRKWCRSGVLSHHIEKKRDGYSIELGSVQDLIEKKLKEQTKRKIAFNNAYSQGFNDAKKLYKRKDMNDMLKGMTADEYYEQEAQRKDFLEMNTTFLEKYARLAIETLREYNPSAYVTLGNSNELISWANNQSNHFLDRKFEIIDVLKKEMEIETLDLPNKIKKNFEIDRLSDELVKNELVSLIKRIAKEQDEEIPVYESYLL